MPLIIILLLILLIFTGAGYYFARVLIYPKVFPFEETYRQEVDSLRIVEAEYLPWAREEVRIRSLYGYDLVGFYHPLDGAKKTVVITHGISWSRYGAVKYAPMYRRKGFNVLIYDIRHHGLSGGPDTSFGFYEKNDLKAVVDWAFQRLGPGGIVGTVGESLGAGTTLEHAGIDQRIAFAVADSAYSVLPDLLKYRLKVEYRLPAFPLLYFAQAWVRLIAGWSFDEASPMRYVPEIETPIFFIHGKEDDLVPPKMSIDLYRAKGKGIRKLYLAPGAGHVQSVVMHPAEYEQKLEEFLAEVGL